MSANKRSEKEGTGGSGSGHKPRNGSGTPPKQRSGDLGRALRSVYDDTLRESVPDDLRDLLSRLD